MAKMWLNYEECGSGQPLILLHGNSENLEYFVNQIDYFAHDFRVIAVDTRGHGKSPRGEAPFTINQFADDLYNFMHHQLGIKTANILGFSDGGNIALQFALRYPQNVMKLVLNGANLDPSGVKRSVQKPIELAYKMACAKDDGSNLSIRTREMLSLMVNEPHIQPAQLTRLRMPVLVIAGNKDMIKGSHTKLIAKSIPNAQLQIINGDHFCARDNPSEFNACVYKFLKG